MNKEEILEAFYKDRPPVPHIKDLCQTLGGIMTPEVQEPCALSADLPEQHSHHQHHQHHQQHPDDDNPDSDAQEDGQIEKSRKSAFSEVAIDKVIYNDILANRKKHNLFLEFEQDLVDHKTWYFSDAKGHVSGPLSARQMNDLFQLGKFTEAYSFSRDPNAKFNSLSYFIRKYYIQIAPKTKIHDKRKSECIGLHDALAKFSFHDKGYKLERPEEKGLRQVRLLSHEVKPDLSFLEGVVEDLEWNEVVQTRGRSSTLN